MNVIETEKSTNYFSLYVNGLLKTVSKKTCVQISKVLNKSHDTINRAFQDVDAMIDCKKRELQTIITTLFKNKKVTIICDETVLAKDHAVLIEGIDQIFDGSTGRICKGICVMTVMITDGIRTLPAAMEFMISKNLSEKTCTKSDVFQKLMKQVTKWGLKIVRIVADGHYSTKKNLAFLSSEVPLSFLFKIRNDAIITINNKKLKLRNTLTIQRNQWSYSLKAEYNGNHYYFYVIKRAKGKYIYLIASDELDHKQVKKMYDQRWVIECFHRTIKQKLGAKDCQMRKHTKQQLHYFAVMFAYIHAEKLKYDFNLDSVDHAINQLRLAKPFQNITPIKPSDRGFGHAA